MVRCRGQCKDRPFGFAERADRSCGACCECCLDRGPRPKGPEDLDRGDCREGEFGGDVVGDARQPEDAQLNHATGVAELLQVVAAVVLDAEGQLAPGHCPVYSARPSFELAPDGCTNEVRPVREEALVDEQVKMWLQIRGQETQ
jgi:hypothetical protein